MLPVDTGDGMPVFLMGLRNTPAEAFRYLRVPADEQGSLDGFLRLRQSLMDPAMRERLAKLNPTASAKVANRLLEASRRQYWTPDAATLEALQRAGEELEDRLEGVFEEKVAA